uniref:Uncharacterized protein n=1 Tax=Junco hyemalis TaxID=40217 RepID=A0A8C5ICT9_JUNHY
MPISLSPGVFLGSPIPVSLSPGVFLGCQPPFPLPQVCLGCDFGVCIWGCIFGVPIPFPRAQLTWRGPACATPVTPRGGLGGCCDPGGGVADPGRGLGCQLCFGVPAVFLGCQSVSPLSPGHLAGPVLCHSFCNSMGFPALGAALGHPRRRALLPAYLLGVLGFLLLLHPLTEPAFFGARPPCRDPPACS